MLDPVAGVRVGVRGLCPRHRRQDLVVRLGADRVRRHLPAVAVRRAHVLVQLALVPVERGAPVVVEEQLDAGQPEVRAVRVVRLEVEVPVPELLVAEVDRQVGVDPHPEPTAGVEGTQVLQSLLVDELLGDARPPRAHGRVDRLVGVEAHPAAVADPVRVRVDETRQHRPSTEVHDARRPFPQCQHVVVVTDRDDPSVADRDRFGPRQRLVHRQHDPVVVDHLGRSGTRVGVRQQQNRRTPDQDRAMAPRQPHAPSSHPAWRQAGPLRARGGGPRPAPRLRRRRPGR